MDEEERHRSEFWMKAATWTFGLWAVMIPITGKIIVDGQNEIRDAQIKNTEMFTLYREQDSRLMAILQERQDDLRKRTEKLERHVETEGMHRK